MNTAKAYRSQNQTKEGEMLSRLQLTSIWTGIRYQVMCILLTSVFGRSYFMLESYLEVVYNLWRICDQVGLPQTPKFYKAGA